MKKFRLIITTLFSLIISVNTFADLPSHNTVAYSGYKKFEKLFLEAKAPTEMDKHLGAYLGECFIETERKEEKDDYHSIQETKHDGDDLTKVYLIVRYDERIKRIGAAIYPIHLNRTEDVPDPIRKAWNYLIDDNDLESYLWTLYKVKNEHIYNNPFPLYFQETAYKANTYYSTGWWKTDSKLSYDQTNLIRIDLNGELITKGRTANIPIIYTNPDGKFIIKRSIPDLPENSYCRWHKKKVSCSNLPTEHQPPEGCY